MRTMTGMAGTLGAVLLAATLVPSATAAPGATTDTAADTVAADNAATVCSLRLGSVTAAGGHRLQVVSATRPPKVMQAVDGPKNLFPAGQTRIISSIGWEPGPPEGEHRTGYLTIGNALYDFHYHVKANLTDVSPESFELTRVGGGWTSSITYVEESIFYPDRNSVRGHNYALFSGLIYRWNRGWHGLKVFKGYDAVKTMALISQTATYDTFLANTRGGALYTIRIPTSANAVPIVKKVRTRTWQGFEALVAEKCGRQSTLLLGIDKDTGAGYLYAMSHATGTSTIIQSLGKVSGANFSDPAYARFWRITGDPTGALNGE